ncbi:polysaccharide deacetylase family protein [Motilibacter rhizosphaerae]|uniref:polysaccharide deacetylase family protein n=1 Tax=Motilibacter rhizosphaerae TaxID=598652 RepID=UPI001E62F117|nr:polysaccharide deacetylase family protein [Motilibacter rhizosphaerae]
MTSAREIGSGPRTVPRVALTFHGAGDLAIARQVLGELRRAHVQATVLVVGSWLGEYPAAGRLVLDDGHEIGNHTEHHKAMRGLGAATAYAEVKGCADRLRKLTGSEGAWFRPSGTQHTTPTIRRAAARAGYAECLSYDLDSRDWTDPGTRAIVRTVVSGARPGSIVSLHLGHRGTIAAVPAILEGLHAKGLAPVSVSTLLA